MTDEKLIEEARKAIHGAIPGTGDYADWVKSQAEGRDFLGDIARAAFAVFEKAHAPTDDEREALIDKLLSLDLQGTEFDGGSIGYPDRPDRPAFWRISRKTAEAWADALAGFRRSEVPEPQREHFHIWSDLPCKPGGCRMEPQGEPFSDHSERYVPKRPKEPQGEPSDAEVGAALLGYFPEVKDQKELQKWGKRTRERMRAALYAAGQMKPSEENRHDAEVRAATIMEFESLYFGPGAQTREWVANTMRKRHGLPPRPTDHEIGGLNGR